MIPPYPPQFVPGDLVEVIGVAYPPGSDKVKPWLGLFQDVGYPVPTAGAPKSNIDRILTEHLVGHVQNGERCFVIAVRFCDNDKKWYYLLRTLGQAPGREARFGWTRTAIRLRKEAM